MPVRLFVGNLPYDATEDEIRAHFSTAGSLASVFLPVDRETGRKRGFAFVEFVDGAAAQEAIRLFNNQPFKGRPLAVNEARAKEAGAPRPPGGGYGGGGGYRPAGPGGGPPRPGGFSRPSGPPMGRPSGPPMGRGPAPDFNSRTDDPARAARERKFGPDAKPARNRAKIFKTEGGKKAFKEKLGGQIFGEVNDEEDFGAEPEIDNFATSEPEDEKE
jgi:RNA recognition motif-containing protein